MTNNMNVEYHMREGGDIFAADMIHVEEHSSITAIFEDSTILITGGTGYLGKMFLEKLLRVCQVKMIYLLLRPKKGKDIEKRFQEVFDGPNMVPMRLSNPRYLNQVSIINGDCALPDLGLKNGDKSKLLEEVNFIIHCAATENFDVNLKQAAHTNLRAVRDLLAMAKQMRNLWAFLHVSTAFSNCPRKEIGEEIYKPGIAAHDLLNLVEMLDDERLDNIQLGICGEWPNSNVFTKAIAENLIDKERKNLPIAILRPSMVIGSLNEPVSGWMDNFYGPTGITFGAAIGLMRSIHGNKKNVSEMIPADYVVNSGFAILWDIASTKSLNNNVESRKEEESVSEKDEVPIYNAVSSVEAPITWEKFMEISIKHFVRIPSERQIWHDFFTVRSNRIHHVIAVFFLHTIPAYIVDFLCICLGRKPTMVKVYQKIHKFSDVSSYFACREWIFKNDNIQNLWKKLSREDQRLFQFSMKNFDWDNYFYFFARGLRVYLVKDPLDTIPQGRIHYWKLFIYHYTLIAVLLFLFYMLLSFLWSCVF